MILKGEKSKVLSQSMVGLDLAGFSEFPLCLIHMHAWIVKQEYIFEG